MILINWSDWLCNIWNIKFSYGVLVNKFASFIFHNFNFLKENNIFHKIIILEVNKYHM